jgi:hypothetical protein
MKYLILSLIWIGYFFFHGYLSSVRFSRYLERLLKTIMSGTDFSIYYFPWYPPDIKLMKNKRRNSSSWL